MIIDSDMRQIVKQRIQEEPDMKYLNARARGNSRTILVNMNTSTLLRAFDIRFLLSSIQLFVSPKSSSRRSLNRPNTDVFAPISVPY